MDTRTARKIKKATTTTRGTSRQRAPKGLRHHIRTRVLQDLPLEDLERLMNKKLQGMPVQQRLKVKLELAGSVGEVRHEVLVSLLA